jgi:hypothetical protein
MTLKKMKGIQTTKIDDKQFTSYVYIYFDIVVDSFFFAPDARDFDESNADRESELA